jgi:iron complex transport system permease protein
MPRVLLAFIAGAALSVSGAVMQSLMRNPLASSYTLGVSSGASLGAALVMFYGVFLGALASFALPVMGFAFGLMTIFAALFIAKKLDRTMQNNTIILVGMVFSLFVSAITTLMSSIRREYLEGLFLWQMGSFASRGLTPVLILAPLTLAGVLLITRMHKELDILTFGESQALTMGINTNLVKRVLLVTSAALTGAAIAFCGVIGFVDLVAPHIVRKLFGAAHRFVVPMSAVFGGIMMVLADLAARTVGPVGELPVGAVTALIGAPFFCYVFFAGRKHETC